MYCLAVHNPSVGQDILLLNPNFIFDRKMMVGECGSEDAEVGIKGDALGVLDVYTPLDPLARYGKLLL